MPQGENIPIIFCLFNDFAVVFLDALRVESFRINRAKLFAFGFSYLLIKIFWILYVIIFGYKLFEMMGGFVLFNDSLKHILYDSFLICSFNITG